MHFKWQKQIQKLSQIQLLVSSSLVSNTQFYFSQILSILLFAFRFLTNSKTFQFYFCSPANQKSAFIFFISAFVQFLMAFSRRWKKGRIFFLVQQQCRQLRMRIQYIIISFYQVQQRMFTPNKKKSRASKLMQDSFEPSDFVELASTEPLYRKCEQGFDKQNVAKDALIEIGEAETAVDNKNSLKSIPLTIDSWVSNQVRIRNHVRIDQVLDNNFCYNRNARSVTAGLIKYKDDQEQNTVQKLKEALKKLESPEKVKKKQRKFENENKIEILEALMSKRKIETKVSDLIRLKQCQGLKVNKSSSNYHSRKISTSMQNRMKKLEAPFYSGQPLDTRRLNQLFNFQYKEARRNRTLKRILN